MKPTRFMFRPTDEDREALARLTAYRYQYGQKPVVSDILRDALHYHATAITKPEAKAADTGPSFDETMAQLRQAVAKFD